MVRGRLRAMCEEKISSLLTCDNAALTLLLADQHHAESARANALAFIGRNAAEVLQSEGWRHLSEVSPQLVQDVLRTMALGDPPEPTWAKRRRITPPCEA